MIRTHESASLRSVCRLGVRLDDVGGVKGARSREFGDDPDDGGADAEDQNNDLDILNPGPENPVLRCWLRKPTSPFGLNLPNSVCLASLGARILNTIKPHDFMLRQIKF